MALIHWKQNEVKRGIAMEENNNLSRAEGSSVAEPDAAEASAEEIRKAKELLRANGYGLVAYREMGEKIKRGVGIGVGFVKGKGKAVGGWLSAKRDELKARQEEWSRAAAEKRRLAEEAEARRAEVEAASAGTIAESRSVGSGDAPKCAACGAELVPGARFCRKCGKPASFVRDTPAAEPPAEAKSTSASVGDSAGSDAPKCAACGTVLAVGMKFCGECGTPVNAGARKSRKRKTTHPRKDS